MPDALHYIDIDRVLSGGVQHVLRKADNGASIKFSLTKQPKQPNSASKYSGFRVSLRRRP